MNKNMVISEFRPLFLTVEKIGPFQEKPFILDMTDEMGEPCNLFLLLSKNGRGKTTLLEIIRILIRLLDSKEPENFQHEDLDSVPAAWAKLNIRTRFKSESGDYDGVMSIVAGDFPQSQLGLPEKDCPTYLLEKPHTILGFRRRTSGRIETFILGEAKEQFEDFAWFVRTLKDKPQDFGEPTISFPTLLYFDAIRDVPPISTGNKGVIEPAGIGYRIHHHFGNEGVQWADSLDNLLVWLKWLDNGSFERAADLINGKIFVGRTKFLKEIRKQPPQAVVQNGKTEHRLDRLSSGEKSVLQILLRIDAHRTLNTWVLLDELDAHLHPNMEHWFLKILKTYIIDNPGLTVIASSHSRELIKSFAPEIREKGLVKGGHIIKDDLEVPG